MTLKELDSLIKQKQAQQSQIKTIKTRLKNAAMFKHMETCKNCRGTFNAYMHTKSYATAGETASKLLSSIITQSKHKVT